MSRVIGIDLGTTYSAVAIVNEHGEAKVIPNREGERITPSVVLFDGDTPIVGRVAKELAVANPQRVVQFVKRQMGNPNWSFRTESGAEYSPEEISAIILKHLKEGAEAALGEKIDDAVISVPAYFDDAQRKATRDAGRIAGLNVLRIINEPTAAALAYGIEWIQQPQTVLVYDLGGGTFDVTIMRISEKEIDVLATGGDRNLGGFDWDNEVMMFLNVEFQKEWGIDLFDDPGTEQNLRDKAENAKRILSRDEETDVYLFAKDKGLSIITLTREQFDSLTAHLLRRTQSLMEIVLEDAGLTSWTQVDKILLAGGSTRMSAVVALIEEVTGKRPSSELGPDEAVALGAACQGALLAVQKGTITPEIARGLPPVKIRDVNSHSMGVIAVDINDDNKRINSIVLQKGTHIPCKVSDIFGTIQDQQPSLHIEVTEGEDTDPKYVTILGEGKMSLPPYPKGAPIEVFFAYDADGIVHVTVFDQTANQQLGELWINRTSNLTEREIQVARNKLTSHNINKEEATHFSTSFSVVQKPLRAFLSYVQEDELYILQLEKHLNSLKRQGFISTWHHRQIVPGANRVMEVDQQLEQASLILLFVSADFLASDYHDQVEIKRSMERHKTGQACVIPIIVRPVDWKGAPFAHLQALPTAAKAITIWSNQDEAWVNVAQGIRKTCETLLKISNEP